MKCHLETSSWKFEDEDSVIQKRNFDPYKRLTLSSQRKKDNVERFNQTFERETRRMLVKEIEQMQLSENDTNSVEENVDENRNIEFLRIEPERNENIENLREPEIESNPYLVLLNRLDEEEGVRMPSIDDKLKLAEDRLRISTQEFCSSCEYLIDVKQEEKLEASEENNAFLQPALVQELFRPKIFEPSLRPPTTLHAAELEKKPLAGQSTANPSQKEEVKMKKEVKSKEYSKQSFYLPSKTWSSQGKQETNVTQEELEFLNSTSTKAFLQFLSSRKKEPPKIIQDIKKKVNGLKNENH